MTRRAGILIGLAAYLGGLLLGLAFIIAVPYVNDRADLMQLAAEQAESVLETYSASSSPTYGTSFI